MTTLQATIPFAAMLADRKVFILRKRYHSVLKLSLTAIAHSERRLFTGFATAAFIA
jgi:hypothetical protein